MRIHQSDLSALSRCAAQYGYSLKGWRRETNSAAAYGSVVHHALHVLERELHLGMAFEPAVQTALETFVHYWNPLNIEAICEPVPADGWLPRQGYSEMRTRGINAIRMYAEMMRFDESQLLAIEFGFVVPIAGTWDPDLEKPHELAGTVDRLVAQRYLRKPVVGIHDWKTGKQQVRLRHNLQFTAYAYASTRPEFWLGWQGEDGFGPERGEEMYLKSKDWARRGTWIDLRAFKQVDAGWRAQKDYDRFALAVMQYVALIREDVFPLTLNGDVCTYCEYRRDCGGTGIAADDEGKPGVK